MSWWWLKTVEAEKTTAAPIAAVKKPSHGSSDDDVFQAYINRGGSGSSHKWNEHQYFVKAMEDLHRSQQDKMTKVSLCVHSPLQVCLLY